MCWRVGFFGKLWRLKTLSDVAGFDVDFIAYGSILVVIYIYIQFKFSDCVKKYILVYLEVCMYLWCTSIYPEMHRCTCTYPYYRFYFLGYEMEGPLNALGNKPLPSVLSKLVLYSFIHSCDVGWIIAYIPCANKLEHQSHSCNMYNQIVWCNILIYLLHIYTHTCFYTCTNNRKYTYLRTYLVFCCEDAFISSFVVPLAQALGRNCRFLQPKGSSWARGCASSWLVPSLKVKGAWPCPWPSDSVWSASNLNLYSYLRSWDFYAPNRYIFSTVQ